MELYQLEICPYCAKVRRKLDQLGLDYARINVSPSKEEREEVFRLSGQRSVPVLKDGEQVVADSEKILAYLSDKYGA